MDSIIKINHLSKSYGCVKAVDDISFEVARGSLFAFLGVNGAGKSTTINILCTLLSKDAGDVIINGHDLDTEADKIKNDIGIVFQNGVMDTNLTVKENLRIRSAFYGIYGDAFKKRLRELDELLSLSEILGRDYGKLSGGQKRRVDIARALINEPKILFLDEPTTGLDPSTRRKIWEIVSSLQEKNNTTIFLTTHYMEEADNANNVVIIDKGHVIACDTPTNLKNKYSGTYIKIYTSESDFVSNHLKDYNFVYENGYYKILVDSIKSAKDFVVSHAKLDLDFEIIKGNMDDVFLNATGKSLKEVDYEQVQG